MNSTETKGLVFWNTWYRASAEEQMEHVERLDERMRSLGAQTVLFCLSEVSSADGIAEGGLLGQLGENGFQSRYTPVSYVRDKKLHEGLSMTSRDELDFDTFAIYSLGQQRGIASRKQRQAVRMNYGAIEVVSAHLSYPRPRAIEIDGLRSMIRGGNQVFGGDFNTLISKSVVTKLGYDGLVPLEAHNHRATVPVPGGRLGFTLDHVLISQGMLASARLEVGEAGPSNHRPLLVAIE